jgi:hypothetical protein
MITLTPVLSRRLADRVQGLDFPARVALYDALDAATTPEAAAALIRPGKVGSVALRAAEGGTSAAQAAGAIGYIGRGPAAQVMERLHAAYPAGYRQALNTVPPPGRYAQVGAGRLVTVMPQPYPERVDGYRAQLRNGPDNLGPSIAVAHEGVLCLVDGTHRAVARVLEGHADLPVHLLDLAPAKTAASDDDDDCYVDVTAAFDAAAHDFIESEHPRGYHGRFGHGTRPAGLPSEAAPGRGRVRTVGDLAERASRLEVRQRVGYAGHDLDRTANKGYRVRLKTGEVQHYDKPEHAAKAAFEGKHFTPREVSRPEGPKITFKPRQQEDPRYGEMSDGPLRLMSDEGDKQALAELKRRGVPYTPRPPKPPAQQEREQRESDARVKRDQAQKERDKAALGERAERDYPKGTRVEINISDGGWFKGEVVGHDGAGMVHVRTDRGIASWAHVNDPSRLRKTAADPPVVQSLVNWSKEFGSTNIHLTKTDIPGPHGQGNVWEVRGLPDEAGFTSGGMKLLNEDQIKAIADKLARLHAHQIDMGVRQPPEPPRPKAVTDLIAAYRKTGVEITVTRHPQEQGMWRVRGLPGYDEPLLSEDMIAMLAARAPKPKRGADPARALSATPPKPRMMSPLQLHFLQEYRDAGGSLTGFDVQDRDQPLTIKQLAMYAKVPPEFRRRLAAEGAELYFGTRPVTELDDLRSLRNTQPSGYAKGKTFSKVAAVHSQHVNRSRPSGFNSVVAIGGGTRTYGTGSVNVSAHETGHALDFSLGNVSERDDFRKLYDQAVGRLGRHMRPYYTPGGNPVNGRKEFLAETFAAWTENRDADPELRAQNIMRAIGGWPPRRPGTDVTSADEERIFAEMVGERLGKFYDKLHTEVKRSPNTPKGR